MLDTLRLYVLYAGASVRGQMQYRVSFLMASAGQFLATGLEFLGLWALFSRFGSLREWTMPEVALFYGMVSCAFAVAEGFARGFDTFDAMVKAGDFDRVLLRPRSTVLQIAARELQLMRVGRLSQGLFVLLYAAWALDIVWSPAKVALTVAAVLGGACAFSGLFVLQATMCFWSTDTLEIMNTMTYGGVEAAQYPLTIYTSWFRRFFTFVVPLACINYFPAHAILGRPDALGTPPLLHWMAPVAGVAFLTVTLRVWSFGVRRYRSTGS